MMLVCLTTAIPSAAWWGKTECSAGAHCYSETQWRMTHAGENVRGAEDIPETWSMAVPQWEYGTFVDNEMWLIFEPSEGWLEIGQESGSFQSCCTLHPFIAHGEYVSNGEAVGYEAYTWNSVVAEPRNLYRIEDPASNGTWCEYIWNNQVDCKAKPGHWTTYANYLQAGIEAATETKPTNSGAQEVDFVTHNGEHRQWGSASPVTGYVNPGPYAAHELCLSPNPKSNHPGNADWSTC
jgi:hypothetical protein